MNSKIFSTGYLQRVLTTVAWLWLTINQSAAAPGDLDTSFNPSVDSTVRAMAVQPDGKILIGGDFTSVNNTNRDNIARLNVDGSLDTSFDSGLATDNRNGVYSIVVQSDGKILIGGFLVTDNSTNNILRLNSNGSVDNSFVPEAGVSNYIYAYTIAIQPDGKVIYGSDINAINMTNTIARLNTNGSPDITFNPGAGTDDAIRSIVLQPDGKIIIGGWFVNVNGTNRNRIARLNADGSLDESFDPGTGADSDIESVVLQPDGKIVIGGDFADVNGNPRNGIARLNANGSVDASFDPGAGVAGGFPPIFSVALQFDGKIFIGGKFTTVNSTNRNRIARLNGDGGLDTVFNPGIGANSNVISVAVQSDDRVLLGGLFTSVNGVAHLHLARLIGDTRLRIQRGIGGNVVVSWPNGGFTLQSAPFFTGTFTNTPGATSPYTNSATASQQYFRLKAD